MRKNKENAAANANPKTINHNPNEFEPRFAKVGKIAKHLSSHVFLLLIVLGLAVPPMADKLEQEQEARAFAAAIINGYHEALAEDERAAAEAALMADFNEIRTAIYREAVSYSAPGDFNMKDDMEWIGRNIVCRLKSPNYPKTIKAVVGQYRVKDGKKVWHYSFKGENHPRPPHNEKWKAAGRATHVALVEYFDNTGPAVKDCPENYFARYVKPGWSVTGQRDCLLKPYNAPGAYHHFFTEVPVSERKSCKQEQATQQLAAATAEVKLPKVGPKPLPRPSTKVASAEVSIEALIAQN